MVAEAKPLTFLVVTLLALALQLIVAAGAVERRTSETRHKHSHANTTTSTEKRSHATKSSVRHSQSASRSDTHSANGTVLVRDRHGKLLRRVPAKDEPKSSTHEKARASSPSRVHMEKRRVVVVTRDRHGRVHKVTRVENVRIEEKEERTSSRTKAPEKAESKATVSDDEPKEVVHISPNFTKTYALYDQGVNARIAREYQTAISDLGRGLDMVPGNDHGGISVLQLNMEYDLALAAEQKGDLELAARYFARAVADRPNFTEASVRLATVLAKSGNYPDALKAARAGVERSPGDPRSHALLAVILAKMGLSTQASVERQKSLSLLANPVNIHLPPEPVTPPPAPATDSPSVNGSTRESHDETQEMIPTEAPMSQPDTDNGPATPGSQTAPSSSAPMPGKDN